MSQDEVQRMLDEMNMSGGSEKPEESAEPAESAEPVETPTEEIIDLRSLPEVKCPRTT